MRRDDEKRMQALVESAWEVWPRLRCIRVECWGAAHMAWQVEMVSDTQEVLARASSGSIESALNQAIESELSERVRKFEESVAAGEKWKGLLADLGRLADTGRVRGE